MQLVKTSNFDGIRFDCYQDSSSEFYGTREQIGQMLGYAYPRESIAKIHDRNKERLDKFSSIVNLTTDAGERTVVVYNFKGLLEICRYSNQPKADAVMDFLWEIADEIRRVGNYSLKPVSLTRAIMSASRMVFETAGLHGEQLALALDKVVIHYTGESALAMGEVQIDRVESLTSTQIGTYFNKSAAEVNRILANAGYQYKSGTEWEALPAGESYAVKGEGRHLKWKSSILNVLRELTQ